MLVRNAGSTSSPAQFIRECAADSGRIDGGKSPCCGASHLARGLLFGSNDIDLLGLNLVFSVVLIAVMRLG